MKAGDQSAAVWTEVWHCAGTGLDCAGLQGRTVLIWSELLLLRLKGQLVPGLPCGTLMGWAE